MHQAWQPLLANFAVIAVFISCWTTIEGWLEKHLGENLKTLFGLCCGGVSIAVMSMPFEVVPGIFFDLRAVTIMLASFFGGPVGGFLAASLAAAFRVFRGGEGMAAGVTGIAVIMIIGMFLHWQRRRSPTTFRDILDIAFAGASSTLLVALMLPSSLQRLIFEQAALPFVTLVFTSTLLAGSAILLEKRRSETARANEIYGAIMDALPDCLNAKDMYGRFLVANPATAVLMGAATKTALIGRTDADFYEVSTAAEFRADETRIVRAGQPETLEQRFTRADGKTAWLSTLKAPFPLARSGEIGIITHNRDITAHKELELRLTEAQTWLSDALTNMADGLVMFNSDGKLVYSSDRFRKMFSIPDHVMLSGMPLRTILQQAAAHMQIILPDGMSAGDWVEDELAKVARMESIEFQLADGRWFSNRHAPVRDGAWLTVFSDITGRKKSEQSLMELNAQLEILARTDGLTGLANRKTFDDRFYAEFARSQRHGGTLGLMMLDADRFKAYNDIYGHPEGDACLMAVANCIKTLARRPTDLVARYGGEEFVAIFPEIDEAGLLSIAERCREIVRDLKRVHAGSEKGIVTVSIGLAFTEGDTSLRGPADLLRLADAALYRAKGAGRDCIRVADSPAKAVDISRDKRAS